MSKRFTLAEAQSLLPLVERLVLEAVAVKPEFEQAERTIESFTERVMMMGGMEVDRDRVLADRNRREAAADKLRHAIQEIQELGCLVKDLDMGLVDFPTTLRGEEVYLCWKLGESSIGFWHGTNEGFRGRKPIDQDFLAHHRGEPEQ